MLWSFVAIWNFFSLPLDVMLRLVSSTCCPSPSIASLLFTSHRAYKSAVPPISLRLAAHKHRCFWPTQQCNSIWISNQSIKFRRFNIFHFWKAGRFGNARAGVIKWHLLFCATADHSSHDSLRPLGTDPGGQLPHIVTILSHSRADLLFSLSSYMILWPIVCLQLYGL